MSQTATAGEGHNSSDISGDRLHALKLLHKRSFKRTLEAKKVADAAHRNLGKLIKSELGDEGVPEIKAMIECETDEGRAKVEARAKAITRALAFSADDDGQFDMFAGKPKSDESSAYHQGKIAGMDDEAARSPYNEATSDGEDWLRGHAAGKAVLDELMASRAADAEDEDGDELVKAGGDLDDEDGAPEAA